MEFTSAFTATVIVMILIFLTSTLVILLLILFRSQRRALRQIREQEIELKQERDLREIIVTRRMREDRAAKREQLENVYRLAEFGELASGFFHDLASPLTDLALRLETLVLLTKNSTDEIRGQTNQALASTERLIEFTRAVLKQMNNQESDCQFALLPQIQEAIDVLGYKSSALDVPIALTSGSPVSVSGNAVKFYQVMVNLLVNALDAYDSIPPAERRPIVVEIREGTNRVICTVKDFGCGITPEVLPHIFKKFISTKPSRGGLGLGLATAHRIIQCDMSGEISLASRPGEGTTVTINLPKLCNASA